MLRFFYFDASSWIGEAQSSPRRHGDTEKNLRFAFPITAMPRDYGDAGDLF